MPLNIISYKKAIGKGIEGHLKGPVQKLEDSPSPDCCIKYLKPIYKAAGCVQCCFYKRELPIFSWHHLYQPQRIDTLLIPQVLVHSKYTSIYTE